MEERWGGFQAWRYETRARYVATDVGIRAAIVFFFALWFADSSPTKAVTVAAVFAAIAVPFYAWLWYPRAKAKFERIMAQRSQKERVA